MAIAPPNTAEEFLIENRRKLLAWALRVLPSYEDAEDCVQEASLRIFRFWGSRNTAYLDTWAFKVVRNTAIDALRRGKNQKVTVSIEETWPSLDPHSHRMRKTPEPASPTDNERMVAAQWMLALIWKSLKPWGRAVWNWIASEPHSPDEPRSSTMKVRKHRFVRRMRVEYRGLC